MGHIITLQDGSNHTYFTILDLMDLVDTYMGLEMKTALVEEFTMSTSRIWNRRTKDSGITTKR